MTEVNDMQLTAMVMELHKTMASIREEQKLLPLGNKAARIEALARSIGWRCNELMHLWEKFEPEEVE